MPKPSDAKRSEVIVIELRERRFVDGVLGKGALVLTELKVREPASDIHTPLHTHTARRRGPHVQSSRRNRKRALGVPRLPSAKALEVAALPLRQRIGDL